MRRIAVDSSAAIDHIRPDRAPPPLAGAHELLLPLPVIGELYAGAYMSTRREENLVTIAGLIQKSTILRPTLDTARIYGELRARAREASQPSKLNDLWIAALCLEHDLPLLTNDRGFDTIPGLSVIHW